MADLFDFMTAQALAEEGAQKAADHANAIEPGWSDRAYALLQSYAASHLEFMLEDVRNWAHRIGFPQAPSARAWGAVALRGARERLILRAGYRKTQNPLAHGTPATLWRSLIYREAA